MPERIGPLRRLRVVELAGLGPTLFAAVLLADLGASEGIELLTGVYMTVDNAVVVVLLPHAWRFPPYL